MRIPVIKMGRLEQVVNPLEWYRYREVLGILPEFSSSTVIRFLRKVPCVVVMEEVPGSKVKCQRPVRLYSGQALIDNGYVG